MAAAPQQPQNDNSLAPLWIILGAMLALGLIWFYFHAQILSVFIPIKYYEAKAIGLFTHKLDGLITQLQEVDPTQYEWNDIGNLSEAIGMYLRYPVIAVLAILAVVIFLRHNKSRFSRTFDMERLVETEKDV